MRGVRIHFPACTNISRPSRAHVRALMIGSDDVEFCGAASCAVLGLVRVISTSSMRRVDPLYIANETIIALFNYYQFF